MKTSMQSISTTDLELVTGGGCLGDVVRGGVLWGLGGGVVGSAFPAIGSTAGMAVGAAFGAGRALLTSPACNGRSDTPGMPRY
jgi:hypothetical protein